MSHNDKRALSVYLSKCSYCDRCVYFFDACMKLLTRGLTCPKSSDCNVLVLTKYSPIYRCCVYECIF